MSSVSPVFTDYIILLCSNFYLYCSVFIFRRYLLLATHIVCARKYLLKANTVWFHIIIWIMCTIVLFSNWKTCSYTNIKYTCIIIGHLARKIHWVGQYIWAHERAATDILWIVYSSLKFWIDLAYMRDEDYGDYSTLRNDLGPFKKICQLFILCVCKDFSQSLKWFHVNIILLYSV